MRRLVAALLAGLSATSALAQTSAPGSSPCSGPEYRSLDFWVGDWIAEDQQGRPIGTNRITRDEYGSCVITEHFRLDDGSLVGHSISIYVPRLKRWRQNWVDNQGSYFDLVGEPVTAADHVFYFENKRIAEPQPFQRMIFQDVKPDSFTWRWQSRPNAGQPWKDSWVIVYRRKPGTTVGN
jgi:hypothetical protein